MRSHVGLLTVELLKKGMKQGRIKMYHFGVLIATKKLRIEDENLKALSKVAG